MGDEDVVFHRGQQWRKGAAYASRTKYVAGMLGHRLIVSTQVSTPGDDKTGRSTDNQLMATSFADWEALEAWEETLPPDEKSLYELVHTPLTRPYFVIEIPTSGLWRSRERELSLREISLESLLEDALNRAVHGIRGLMQEEYGVILETEDFLCTQGRTVGNHSFQVVIPGMVVARADLGARLALAKEQDGALRFVSTFPYQTVQNISLPFQKRHRGPYSSWLEPIDSLGFVYFAPTAGLRLRDFCASFVTENDTVLRPVKSNDFIWRDPSCSP